MDQRIYEIMKKLRSPEQAVWNTQKVVDENAQMQGGMAPNVGGIPTPPTSAMKSVLSEASQPMQELNPALSLQDSANNPANPSTQMGSGVPNLDSLIKKSNASRKNFLTGG